MNRARLLPLGFALLAPIVALAAPGVEIYGTIFYRFQFGLPGLNKAFVKQLVETALRA